MTLMEQDCPDCREKVAPTEAAQLSASTKLGRPVKSPMAPLSQLSVRPLRVAPEGSLFVSVIVCVVAVEPSI